MYIKRVTCESSEPDRCYCKCLEEVEKDEWKCVNLAEEYKETGRVNERASSRKREKDTEECTKQYYSIFPQSFSHLSEYHVHNFLTVCLKNTFLSTSINLWCKMYLSPQNTSYFTQKYFPEIFSIVCYVSVMCTMSVQNIWLKLLGQKKSSTNFCTVWKHFALHYPVGLIAVARILCGVTVTYSPEDPATNFNSQEHLKPNNMATTLP